MKKIIEFDGKAPKRLLSFVKESFPYLPRSLIVEMIGDGNIEVNGKRSSKGAHLMTGDRVTLSKIPKKEELFVKPNPFLIPTVLYEDENILAVDKPRGVPAHPNDFNDIRTLVNAVAAHYPLQRNVGDKPLECGLLNRLDNDTSGIILFAKNNRSFEKFRDLFKKKAISKEYTALVSGLTAQKGVIETAIARHAKNSKKMLTVEGSATARGKHLEAKTQYRTIKHFGRYSLITISLRSAVTHQIRVHLASIGHPVAGDELYTGTIIQGLKGHFLHAALVSYADPFDGRNIIIRSALPEELKETLRNLD